LERFAGKGVALCNLGVLDLLGRGAARGEICLKRGWQHIAVFVFWGNVNREVWDFPDWWGVGSCVWLS